MNLTNSGSYTILEAYTNPKMFILRWHGVWSGFYRSFEIGKIVKDEIIQIESNDATKKFRNKIFAQFFNNNKFIPARNKMYEFLGWATIK